jgi:transcriptional regulator with XRE-family HTH domain
MEATIKLLDKYREARSLASDNACAQSLGVGRAAVSKWRNGGGHPDAESVEAMCKAINEPLRYWLPLIEAERARTPAARKVWLRLAQAAAAFAAAVLMLRHGIDGHATTAFLLSPYTLCEINDLGYPRPRCRHAVNPLIQPANPIPSMHQWPRCGHDLPASNSSSCANCSGRPSAEPASASSRAAVVG